MNDIYCEQIIPGKLKVDIIFETSNVMAFYHTKPYWDHHIVIIPKIHIDSLASYESNASINQDFFEAIKFVTSLLESKTGGCRISSNIGSYQTSKHLHWYVHSGERLRDENGKSKH